MTDKPITYLALGDSYTIGEGVTPTESFPFQLMQELNKVKVPLARPVIIAKTGWTTAALKDAILHTRLTLPFDIVTLLIGVNNQYRNLSPDDYSNEFEELLNMAITFAGGKSTRVFVVSIPDWSVTPFAADYNRPVISAAIDHFNLINRSVAANLKTTYIDITPASREAIYDPLLLTTDQLHPSAKEYNIWCRQIAASIFHELAEKD